jgi:hypothetical protein
MSAAGTGPIILYADQEHGGIRLTIFFALFVGYFIGFQIVARLLEVLAPASLLDYTTFLSCIGGIPIALLFIWGLEKLLKRVWHSGLSLALDERGLTVRDKSAGDAYANESTAGSNDVPAIFWSENINCLNWYFRLKGYPRGGRERRVSAKWLCLATELQQDEKRLNVFSFMPPETAAVWIENPRQNFHPLNPAEIYTSSVRGRLGPPSRPTIPNRLLQSKDGRYWLAERRRWEYGIELTPADFATLMRFAAERSRPEPTG